MKDEEIKIIINPSTEVVKRPTNRDRRKINKLRRKKRILEDELLEVNQEISSLEDPSWRLCPPLSRPKEK